MSSDEQARSGLGLEAQREVLAAAADRHGWELVDEFVDAGVSGRVAWTRRPGLVAAVQLVEAGGADAVAVARLDRLARRTVDALHLVDQLGAGLICLNPELDTTTAAGRLVLTIMAAIATYESELAGERTRAALLAKAARGERIGGRRLCPDDVLELVLEHRGAGATLTAIAAALNTAGVHTPAGSPTWYASHVSRLLRTQDARRDPRSTRDLRRGTLALAEPTHTGFNPTPDAKGA